MPKQSDNANETQTLRLLELSPSDALESDNAMRTLRQVAAAVYELGARMTTKLNRAKQAIRSWASEHKRLRACVKDVRKFWKQYNRNQIDGDEFACLVATAFQFDLPADVARSEPQDRSAE